MQCKCTYHICNNILIINTISSVDDLIENLTKQNEILLNLGKNNINNLNESKKLYPLTNIVQFQKGFEVGSSKYSEAINPGQSNYIRVGDLKTLGNTFVDTLDNYTYADFEDILVAFDGAPVRNNIGLVGDYSSGIYKLNCLNEYKGLVFFEINSKINKQIIDIHTYGTTIKHASKSINFLVYANVSHKEKQILNCYLKQIIQNKKKINFLKRIKDNLLNKYF